MRAPVSLLLPLALGSTLGGTTACHHAQPSPPTPIVSTPAFTRAPDYDDVRHALTTMQRPTLDVFTLDHTIAGRAIPIAVLARPMVRSGAAARHSGKPVVLIVAGADGTDVDGTAALLATLPTLSMPDSIVVIAIPMLNPDAAPGVDLTADLLVPHAIETRMLLGVIATWNPDVVVELRTTDLAPSAGDLAVTTTSDPAALLTAWWTRDRLVPELRRRLDANDSVESAATLPTVTALRNRIGLRVDANAGAPFARRVTATITAIREIVTLVAADRATILDREALVDSTVADWGSNPRNAPTIPLAPHVTTRLPFAYVLDPADSDAAHILASDGITVTKLSVARDVEIIETFVTGHWLRTIGTTTVPAGAYIVPASQPLAILAAILLDPQSTAGLAAAGLLHHPVARLID